jgi:hypothetical protein
MDITQIMHSFASDQQVKIVAVLIAADLVLGVLASIQNQQQAFSLSYVSNFLRNDVLGKVVPFFALYALGKVSSSSVAGVDFGTIADAAWVGVSAALVGSLATSLGDLGISLPVVGNRKA